MKTVKFMTKEYVDGPYDHRKKVMDSFEWEAPELDTILGYKNFIFQFVHWDVKVIGAISYIDDGRFSKSQIKTEADRFVKRNITEMVALAKSVSDEWKSIEDAAK